MMISRGHNIEEVLLVGGKGRHLQKLMNWRAEVAPFFVITTLAHADFQKTGTICPEVEKNVSEFLNQYHTIVFRSSMVGEDHLDASFAGMFDTVLDVTANNWRASLEKVYASIDSPRVKAYLKEKNIVTSLKMAVVVQHQINVEKSGVLFTRSPVPPTSVMAIDAARGMGEGVVSGHSEVENYFMTRLGDMVKQNLLSDGPILNHKEIEKLRIESLRLEKLLGMPADIEWGFSKGKAYIFQIRPITRSFHNLKIFVDTNLSESYPGIVSPFTAAFVKKAYENVFIESAMILGANQDNLNILRPHYKELISSIDNHLYYNLEHYYAVLRSLPGGEKNIENWHKMIGGKVNGSEVPFHNTRFGRLETVLMGARFVKIAWNKENIFSHFLKDLEKMRESIMNELEAFNHSKKILGFIPELMNRPLGFGLTLINDVFIMVGLGFLTKQVRKYGFEESIVIDLLRTTRGIDSVKPLEEFEKLIAKLSDDFLIFFEKLQLKQGLDPYKSLKTEAAKSGWLQESDLVLEFIKNYGDRSFEELKLESLPMKNDPDLFLKLVNWGRGHQASVRPRSIVPTLPKLKWYERKILKFTRECIEIREASRLWRGKYYHIIRETLLKLIEKLKSEDARWRGYSVRDFFSITHHEWELVSKGLMSLDSVENLMVKRKNWQIHTRAYPEILYWVDNELLPLFTPDSSVNTCSALHGLGVSVGEVTAKALVLENPSDILGEIHNDFILVTKNTDPAWVYIMSRSKGLISEKGSLLSHTAIIGRELKIPTVVGVKFATNNIRTGDLIKINGSTGEIIKI